ncbi:hypothetical protein J3R82DRAFT_377 [Butyriboletus roseoflavus]|nr:hypothetical protein J3R82DRAFT_377 [Butyriboletus roseoflavus]
MAVIPLIRQGVLGVTILFSVVELAVSASLISQSVQYYGITDVFCVLGVAVAAISLMTLPVMLVVDILRRGAFTSMIAVELGWLSILWILWVAVAGETAYQVGAITSLGCTYVNTIVNGMCQEVQAIEAFAFLNFIIILLYTGFLFVMTMVAASRGQSVWLSSVKDSFGSPTGSVEHPMIQYNASAAPQPQVYPTGTPAQPQYAASPTQSAATRPAITV